MKKIILFLTYLVCFENVKAQTWVTIPDANFVNYLHNIVPIAMHGDSMDVSSPYVTTYTNPINVTHKNIGNLFGIQYFLSITQLNCDSNSLTSFPPLPNSIKYMDCNYNLLSSLPSLPDSLINFNCFSNMLSNLPNLPNNLISINCGYNNLTSLPSLPNFLHNLYCENNTLTSLPLLPNSLYQIVCSGNSLTSLPALPNVSYFWLDCSNNNISCFAPFPYSTAYLNINANPYNCLPNYVLPAMNSYTITPLCDTGNSNGCVVATGISQISSLRSQISLYPNPSNGNINITSSNSIDELKVTDLLGQTVYEAKPMISVTTLALENAGVYFVTLTCGKEVSTRKIIISK